VQIANIKSDFLQAFIMYRRRKSYFPTRITKKQKRWVDAVVKVLMQPAKPIQVKPQKRKEFSKKTKDAVLRDQNNFCRMCFQYMEVAEFDHINDDRSNNSRFNCQALCPNCHAKKTRRKSN